ncbi:Kinase domain protein [Desulfitobacterium hafniense]|uniref:non-specific serine/threonine protein kinase n=1 Tax=Desulfitobacterium hafniense TaxID=49338 RepID=A0A098B7V1_DESHA|nr:serine/threonine-protein kinase [Desulfitobacterium hafniense]CDX04948.1 Kinase domain protein [Desulfitobacterium hafniense]
MSINGTPILSDPAYRIESELGSGGGGVVYKAWHVRLQKYVVIKELKRGSANDIETQRNEVEALKNVKSAYLPQVFDFLAEGDRVYTVMEFIEGESLDKLLGRGQKFTQPQVIKWYGQLASALEAIHKQNVCHRDIKPANIMLMPNGEVCLIDFNAALVSGNDVRLISRSLGYASPEQYEIYERFKSTRSAPIHLGSSSISVNPIDGVETEYIGDDDNTEFVDDDSQLTESLSENNDIEKTDSTTPSITGGIDWKRSDVYSLGATMYHLLSGKHPSQRATEVIAISKLGRFSEGIVYVIEQSMRLNPSERFASAAILADAVRNIHKHDTRWKVSRSKMIAAAVILPLAFALSAATALFGNSVMAQEKEERYYTAVYEIEESADPQRAYDSALNIFWDRIDPYLAMAKRLWNDGEMDACRAYIEQNLGNIAEFQAVSEAERSFGDIYFILGNCYYYQSGEPDYNRARGHFEIAVQFVKDNPVYFRDYAISLARTGDILKAEQVLEKAQSFNLEADSLNLLNGEINFAKREYNTALDSFDKVISLTDDDYLRYRAYHTSDEIYKLLGQPENSAALLVNALNRIPLDRAPEMTERLADAYVKNGDFKSAIALFEQLSESGAPQFHIMQGLAILLQNSGEFNRAVSVLNQMSDIFPNDFRVPMRQAYLEADRQSKIKNENRDYTLTKQYYDNAVKLYNENVRPGESDPEMQQLDLLIEQLRNNKWIN